MQSGKSRNSPIDLLSETEEDETKESDRPAETHGNTKETVRQPEAENQPALQKYRQTNNQLQKYRQKNNQLQKYRLKHEETTEKSN